jgi:hypothetical protein
LSSTGDEADIRITPVTEVEIRSKRRLGGVHTHAELDAGEPSSEALLAGGRTGDHE